MQFSISISKNGMNDDDKFNNNSKKIIYDRNCIAVPKVDYKPAKVKISIKNIFVDFMVIRDFSIRDFFISLKPLFMYSLIFMITIAVLFSCIYLSEYAPGVEVRADGELICIVKNREQFNMQFDKVINQFKYASENVNIEQKIEFSGKQVKKEDFYTDKEILSNIQKMININVEAYAIVVDNEEKAYLKEEKTALAVLNRIKAPYENTDSNINVSFDRDVRVDKTYVSVSDLNTEEEALDILTASQEEIIQYKVQQGDTLWEIAKANGISVGEILQINPGLTEDIQPDQVVNLTLPKPVLGVKTKERIIYKEHIPFSVEVVDDPNIYEGRRTVVDKGYNGEKEVEAEIISVNGIEREKKIINEVVLIEPKKQVEKIGTKPLPPKFGTGIFMRPSYGILTSRFGSRGGRMHSGIDIGGKAGDPIYAADGGKVVFAGWEGGYGYMVKISHDNEYETWYGHCSSILVSRGQRVAKGELIARIGNTGRSTGPHLHFEIRKNGVPQNPLSYLK